MTHWLATAAETVNGSAHFLGTLWWTILMVVLGFIAGSIFGPWLYRKIRPKG